MRWLAILGILIAALPAIAAERTAEIRLRHISVDEFQTLLLPPEPEPLDSFPGRCEDRLIGAGMVGVFAPPNWPYQRYHLPTSEVSLVPQGVAGWTGYRQRNTVRVSGTAEGIKRFKALVQLADVPPIRVRMTVRLFRASDADLRTIEPTLAQTYDLPDISIAMTLSGAPTDWGFCVLSERYVEQLGRLPGEPEVELTVANNRTVNLRMPAPGATPRLLAAVPQANGDGTVSFQLPRIASPDEPAGSAALQTTGGPPGADPIRRHVERRVAIKQSLFVRPRGSEWAAVLTAVEVAVPKAWRR